MKPHPFIMLAYISVLLSSCNINVPAGQDPAAVSTSAALTVEAVLTPAASPLPTQEASVVPLASPTTPQSTPTASPIPGVAIDGTTAEPAACENIAQITSWTRDGAAYDAKEVEKRLAPNKPFLMSLILKNNGGCVWSDRYKLMFDSGERLTTADTFAIMPMGYAVQPEQELTITVQMAAPAAPGEYESAFSFVNAEGENVLTFGVITKVGSSSSGPLSAPGNLTYLYDCTSGVVITLAWKDKADGEDGYRIYRDGVKLTDLPSGSTTYSDIAPAPGTYTYTVAAFNAGGESPTNVLVQTTNCQ